MKFLSFIIFSLFALTVQAQDVDPAWFDGSRVAHVDYNSSRHYKERTDYFERQEPITSDNIVMIGNSLTENGGDWNLIVGDTDSLIINRGIIGDTAYGIRARLIQILPGQPCGIFLMCGTNDVSHDLTPENIYQRIISVVDTIRTYAPETELCIQSLLPFDENSRWKTLKGKSEHVVAINEMLRQYCEYHNITFVNIYPHLCEEGTHTLAPQYSADGLHLSSEGYEVWGNCIRPYVMDILGK